MAAPREPRTEAERALESRLLLLERRIAAIQQRPNAPANVSRDFQAREGETIYVSAPTAGLSGLLPAPSSQNRGARIDLVFLTSNAVRLTCAGGTVNGQSSITHDVAGAYSAVSDGALGWWLESLYLGSNTNVNTTPTAGDLNVVDISALQCGGVLSFQSVTEANIDGFSVPATGDGFWFVLNVRDASTSASITLIENSGGAVTSIRTPNTRDWRLTKNDSAMIIYTNSRWRVVGSLPKLWAVNQDSVTWAAQQDNFARSGRGYSAIRVTLTGAQTLTGVVPDGTTPGGELLFIENVDTADTLTIAHDATSTAANRFFLPGAANMTLAPSNGAQFRYDSTSDRWRCVGRS